MPNPYRGFACNEVGCNQSAYSHPTACSLVPSVFIYTHNTGKFCIYDTRTQCLNIQVPAGGDLNRMDLDLCAPTKIITRNQTANARRPPGRRIDFQIGINRKTFNSTKRQSPTRGQTCRFRSFPDKNIGPPVNHIGCKQEPDSRSGL